MLVDSEEPVTQPARSHLRQRDGWDLRLISEGAVHLMIQVMETWFVTDAASLAQYDRQGFLEGALPRAHNLEAVAKKDIDDALQRATVKTQKGEYHKIRHAAALLERIDAALVRPRCPACDRLFVTLEKAIDAA